MPLQPRIERIRLLSDTARRYFDAREYLLNIDEDEVSERVILDYMVDKLIEDFLHIGIEFHVSLATICTDLDYIDAIIDLADLVFPQGFYRLMKSDKTYRDWFQNSIRDDLDPENTLIEQFLELIGYTNEVSVDRYRDIVDRLQELSTKSNADFILHIEGMLDIDSASFSFPEIEQEHLTSFLRYVSDLYDGMVNVSQTLLKNGLTTPEIYAHTLHRASVYMLTLTSSHDINGFAWAHQVDAQSPFERAVKQKYVSKIVDVSELHQDRYVLLNTPLTQADCAGIITRYAALAHDPEKLDAALATVRDNLVSKQLLPDVEYWNKLVSFIKGTIHAE